MYRISKLFSFSASHQLFGLPDLLDGSAHPCTRLHGHNYRVELVMTCETLDTHGFVYDYNGMKPFARYLDETLDHRHLNDVLGDTQPTAEHLALHLHRVATGVFGSVPGVALCLRVSETEKTWASYE